MFCFFDYKFTTKFIVNQIFYYVFCCFNYNLTISPLNITFVNIVASFYYIICFIQETFYIFAHIINIKRTNTMKLANNIKKIARLHGKTISQLAAEMGVAQQHLSRTINNERITLKDLEAISEKIGCDVSDFFSSSTLTCPKCGAKLKLVAE